MALNVLEIGYGSSIRSAALSDGDVFNDSGVSYFGVDLPRERGDVKPEHFETIKPVEAHWAALPYADESFGAVAMRSCFGQFRDAPTGWVSKIWSVGFGLLEVARVLEPGGQLFISEENTPQDPDKVVLDVMQAGFDIEAFEKGTDASGKLNPAFASLRQRFYGEKSLGVAGSIFRNQRYVLSARKPVARAYSVQEIKVDGDILAYRRTTGGEWRELGSKITLPYHVPEDRDTPQHELRIARKMVDIFGERYRFWVEQLEAQQEQK